jgi:O-antigen ligase
LKLAITLLFIAAIWLIQCLVGGTRLVYSLPSYGILAIAGLLSLAALRRPIPKPSLICLGTTAIFFTYILARAAASPVAYLWWTDFYMVIACLIAYLITAFYISSSRLRMIVVVGLLVLALAEFLVGLRQFQAGDNWMPFGFVRSDYGSRASGMFISSIHLDGYLEAVGILALSIAVWSTWSLWARIGIGYMALLCYAGVAITGSRGGYLSSMFSLVVFAGISLWVRRSVNPGKFARSALIAGVALVVFTGAAGAIMQRSDLLRTRLGAIVAKDVRFYNWAAALDQFKVSPVIGTGAGTHLFYGRFFRRPQIQADPEHAHSDYLEMLAEYGLIGLAGIAVFVFVHANWCLRAVGTCARNAPPDPFQSFKDNRLALQIGALSAIAAYLAHSVTDFNLHIPGNALLFAFIFGIAANPDGATYPASEAAPGARLLQTILPALSIWMLASGGPKFPGDYWCERARVALYYRNYGSAVEFALKSLRFEKKNPDSYYLLAGAYGGIARSAIDPVTRRAILDSAIAASREGLKLFPQDEHALVRLARTLDAAKRFREAGEAYRDAIAVDPKLGSLRAYFARHLAAVGRNDEAREQLEQARILGSTRDLSAIVRGTSLLEPQE